jgi:isoleucyl-tRNA synthetase
VPLRPDGPPATGCPRKGLVYQGLRVLPYCWNDETPLTSHELRMDEDVYQIRAKGCR